MTDGSTFFSRRSEGWRSTRTLEGKGFARKPLSHPNVPEGWVLTATLVDLNNDGWLDIVATTYRNGNWFILNSGGDFASGEPQLLPNHPEAVATTAVSFGDIDLDGDLDIVLGNWSLGSRNRRGWSPRASRNVWLRNESSGFEVVELVGDSRRDADDTPHSSR